MKFIKDKEHLLLYINIVVYFAIIACVYCFFGSDYIPAVIVLLGLLGIVSLVLIWKKVNKGNKIMGFICAFSWCCVWILALLVLYGLVFFIVDAFKAFL